MASNALKNGNMHGLETQLKDKIEHIDELNKKMRETDEKSLALEEELKSKLNKS